MLNDTDARDLIGATAYSSDGDKIGKVGQLFLDDQTGRPEFVTVNTGLFGTSESFVPVDGARLDGNRLTVPHSKDKVKDAPSVDVDNGHLDPDQEQRLYEYYGRSYAGDAAEHPAGRTQAETDDAMTRSEERLQVGTTSQEAGRARLRKYVTTEQDTVTVPVTKERAVVETEPVTDANVGDALSGPEISEDEHEVVLREERPVVGKTTEPVERVRLGKETTTDEETVTEEVRKEQIEARGDIEKR